MFYFPIPVFTGLWYLLIDDTLDDDVVNGTTRSAFIAIYVHVGFNLLDSILMAVGKLLFGSRFSTALFIHHFVVLTLLVLLCITMGRGNILLYLHSYRRS